KYNTGKIMSRPIPVMPNRIMRPRREASKELLACEIGFVFLFLPIAVCAQRKDELNGKAFTVGFIFPLGIFH
ncbi:MAG: hypothetical protein ACREOI_34900, partial [bacterium]